MWYIIFKWLHILAAITALGANLTYAVWLRRAATQSRQTLLFTLQTIRVLDSRIANPAYGASLITGLVMVYLASWPLTTPWLLTALILYFAILLLGLLVFAPVFRRQMALAESAGPDSPEYAAAARRGQLIGLGVTLIVVIIVFLMVVKPPLWG